MLVLTRKGNDVYHNDVKLTIVAQATKGEGKEVVKIEGLEGSNGQKWVSLSRLVEGENEIECKAREVSTGQRYTLTDEEKAEVEELQGRIDEIIAKAKARYVAPINLKKIDTTKMTEEQRDAVIKELEKFIANAKAGK